ncbi:MAG TPA: hypothetical protein VF834_21775 [Streptosporangiaceae bacterium]
MAGRWIVPARFRAVATIIGLVPDLNSGLRQSRALRDDRPDRAHNAERREPLLSVSIAGVVGLTAPGPTALRLRRAAGQRIFVGFVVSGLTPALASASHL